MLNLFPQGLEGTLVIPIFVGVVVMVAFTEVLGWEFVGVVVPGYLASVALIEPVVAGIVAVEALVTWALAVGLDRGLTRAGIIFPLFGRDRFFLILVASAAVRMALEGFVLQALASWLALRFPELESRRHELFGIGLVLVPLAANRLWTVGPASGLFQLAVQSALVAAVLRLVLLPFTNFSLAGFDPSYDPLALAFLSSPRAPIALLVTAALASLLNRRYGWDFHGILVPALLGLAVLAPVKLLATLVEASLILAVSRALLLLPGLRTMSVEGARRLLLCFSVGMACKMIGARLALDQLPGYRPTDLLGFGYMLPSLIAERIWQKRNAILVLLPTVQTAVLGFVLTTAAAFGLAVIAPVPPPEAAVAAGGPAPPPPARVEGRLLRSERTFSELIRPALAPEPGRPARSGAPARPLAAAVALQLDRSRDQPEPLAAEVARSGLTTTAAAGGTLVLRGENWPTVVLRRGAGAVVSAPYVSEWGAAAAALAIAELLDADGVFSHDDDGAAVALAAALAQRRGRPHIIVRGTERPLGADLLALAAPQEPGPDLPRWIRPLQEPLAGRVSMTTRVPDELGLLRAFPAGAGRVNPTVLLWLSPQGRRVLSAADQSGWARPDLVELARRRGLTVVHGDAPSWLAAGRGSPPAPALERAELLARTGDVARLAPLAGEVRLGLLIDEGRGLSGFSLEQGGRRALVVAGQRREERARIADAGAAELALRRGVRTLVAAEGRP